MLTELTFLGGLGEVGMNMMVFNHEGQQLIVDCGLWFPDAYYPGAHLAHSDWRYLHEEEHPPLGIVLTHAHEDHIGALPYLLRDFDIPVYGTDLTLALLRERLKEFQLSPDLRVMEPGQQEEIGPFRVEWIRVSHSIYNSCALLVETPSGRVLHSGDFKVDTDADPYDGTDLARLGVLGGEGIDLLLVDSTNAQRSGLSGSEVSLRPIFEDIFRSAPGRIYVVTFSSQIERLQLVVDVARYFGRRLALEGRSLRHVAHVAQELGYLHIPPGLLLEPEEVALQSPRRTVVATTGSQAEPRSSMARISRSEHAHLEIEPEDTVIWSARWIPGNERGIGVLVDRLCRLGARVLHPPAYPVHVSGHGSEEDIKILLRLLRPRYLVPIHGEFRFLCQMREVALDAGMETERILLCNNGDRLLLREKLLEATPALIPNRVYLADREGPELSLELLKERRRIAQAGLVVISAQITPQGDLVAPPVITLRGLPATAEQLFEQWPALLQKAFYQAKESQRTNPDETAHLLRKTLLARLRSLWGFRPECIPLVSRLGSNS